MKRKNKLWVVSRFDNMTGNEILGHVEATTQAGAEREARRRWGKGIRAKLSRNPAKFDRCVKAVKKRSSSANAYAVCTAAGTRDNAASYRGRSVSELEKMRVFAEARAYDDDWRVRDTGRRDVEAIDKALANARRREKKRNPADASIAGYEDFHGRAPDEFVTVERKVHFHGNLWGVGLLEKLVVIAIDGKAEVTLKNFEGAILAANEKRNQLFIEGGDQAVNLADFGIDPNSDHETETLGKVKRIDYFTTKDHLGDEGGTATYQHTFRTTNKGGKHVTVRIARYPDLIYRVLEKHLEFSGGSYDILPEGIDR